MICIATFYSHFEAIRYKKICDSKQVKSWLMPVPRDLSSSCGTCLKYEGEPILPEQDFRDEIEQIVIVEENGYKTVYQAKNS